MQPFLGIAGHLLDLLALDDAGVGHEDLPFNGSGAELLGTMEAKAEGGRTAVRYCGQDVT